MKIDDASKNKLQKWGFHYLAVLLANTDREKLPEFVLTYMNAHKFDPYNLKDMDDMSIEQRDSLIELDHTIGKFMYDNAMNTNLMKYQNRTATFQYTVGAILVFVSFLYIFLITWIPIPEQNIRFVDTSLGFLLGTVISTIIMYFFGASASSTTTVTKSTGMKK